MTTLRNPGATALLVLLASGCKGCEADAVLPELLEAEDATPVGVWVAEALGTSPVGVPVFAVNALGAAVPGGDLTLTSDGTVASVVTPDANGWAEVELTGGAGRYTVSASAAGVSGEGAAWVLDSATGAYDFRAAALPGTPSGVAAAGAGLASAVGAEVWWSALDGRPATRVLALPDAIVAVMSAEVDADGVTDLLVWSASRVVVLRGRDTGGLTWGAGWSAADGHSVVGAAVADFDGDNAPDVSVVLDAAGIGKLMVLGGTSWAFTPIDILEPDYAILAVAVDDLDGNGVGEVTFLTDAGLLRRYTKIDDSWAATLAGTQYDLELGAGSRLLPSIDVTNDGIADLLAVGPAQDGLSWRAWVVTAGAADPARYEVVDAEDAEAWVGLTTGDLTGDGYAEILYTAPGRVARGVWTPESENFTVQSWNDAPVDIAVAAADVNADGVPDVVTGMDHGLRALHGDRIADDPATEVIEEVPWRVAAPDVSTFGIGFVAPPIVRDVTGDGIADVVGLVAASTAGVAVAGVLGVAATDEAPETLRSGGSLTLSGAGAAVDLAVCESVAYVLFDEADDTGTVTTYLARVTLGTGMGPALSGEPVVVTGESLACGAFALGEVAVADPAGAVTFYDAVGAAFAGEAIGPVGDLAAADSDGDGLDELVACAEAGCFVAAADLDGDGVQERVTQDSTGITVTLGGTATEVDAAGTASVGDTDGDGVPELIVGSEGLARVFHGLAGGLSPAVTSWTWRPVTDAVWYGDLDGDGLPDAFMIGEDHFPDSEEGDSWVGTLVYARAAAE